MFATLKGMKLQTRLRRIHYLLLAAGFVAGFLALGAVRFLSYTQHEVHYHANFALYVNGQRDPFKSFTFYEEIQACSDHNAENVKAKTHMHDNNSGLIHVHAPGVTWGDFFANLGYGLTDKALVTDNGVYATSADNGNKLSFILNGQQVDSIANKVIHSEDRLLINYGIDDGATLQQRYQSVPSDARKANTTKDPSTCSGEEPITVKDRLRAALGLSTESSH